MKRYINRFVRFVLAQISRAELGQELNAFEDGGQLASDEIVPIARRAAAEGVVLLKNDHVLPIKQSDTVAVFGRCAVDYLGVGYGSGGDVQRPYIVNVVEGLKAQGVKLNEGLLEQYAKWLAKPANAPDEGFWSHWPYSFPEMPLKGEQVRQAAQSSDLALVVIGRAAGEDRENKLSKGSYYLTDLERRMLDLVTAEFKRVAVIMNCGNVIDMSWVPGYGDKLGAVVYAWQGGMESGHGLADVLTGRVSPCGKLSDTIACRYEDLPSASCFGGKEFNNYAEDIYVGYRYFETFAPDKALYPFGFGLSYTSFNITAQAEIKGTKVSLTAKVKNTGERAGKEVVQAYASCPQGVLGKPERELAAFAKTQELQPGESQTLSLTFDLKDLASYDDAGKTGHKAAYVLEAGEYVIFAGSDVRSAAAVKTHTISSTAVTRQCSEVMAAKAEHVFQRLTRQGGKAVYEPVPTVTTDLKQIILDRLPEEIPFTGDKGLKLQDVKAGKCSLEEFIAQLTPQELDDLSHGEGKMGSKLGIAGNAGAFGGITQALRDKGVPPVITTDGPAGIRIKRTCALLPCGTMQACSFDLELVQQLYAAVANEMKHHGSHVLLAPGMNIHRDPLCGRNFEYFSEDPRLSGRMAAAVVKGLQENGVSASPKHFACNNQERNRNKNDSRLSERALREIYLKGFELMVQESSPHTIMTSYNKINGVWSHYNYELATTVLREEWGFEGLIITDWWMQKAASPEFPLLENDAYRLRAQVDVLMPGGDGVFSNQKTGRLALNSYGNPEGITLAELQRTAANVLRFLVDAPSFSEEKEAKRL